MKTLSALSIALMACLAIGISTARGQVIYSLEDLGVVENMDASVPAALNNQGYVAGTAYKGEETCAFHYDYIKKFMQDAGGVNSRAIKARSQPHARRQCGSGLDDLDAQGIDVTTRGDSEPRNARKVADAADLAVVRIVNEV